MMEKQCVKAGCTDHPVFGYGSVRKGPVKFACAEHRHLIWFDRESPRPSSMGDTVEKAEGERAAQRSSSAITPSQGRLL